MSQLSELTSLNQIKEQATVVEVLADEIIVSVVRTSACGSCKARQGCGQGVLAEWGNSEKQQAKNHFKIPFSGDCEVGDTVELGMAHDTVSKVAMIVYMSPLLLGFIALLVGRHYAWTEIGQLVFFVFGVLMSFAIIRQFNLLKSEQLVPEILQLYRTGKGPELITSTLTESV